MGVARKFDLDSPVWVVLSVLVAQLVAFGTTIPDYHPQGDDIALIVHATPHVAPPDPLEWITRGFSGYFTVYPEWTSPFSHFVRPVVQTVYYLDHLLFQDYWGLYLLLTYLVHAAAAGIVFVIARLFLHSSRIMSWLSALVFSLTVIPGKAAFQPAFAFDPLAAVLAGSAFLAMAQSRFVAAALLITIALFTKETVILAPLSLSASFLVLVWTHPDARTTAGRPVRAAAAMFLLPLSAWFFTRQVFLDGLGGTYISRNLDSWGEWVRKLLLGLSVWPLGHDLAPIAASLRRLVTAGPGGLLPGDAANVWFVLANLAFGAWFGFMLIQAATRIRIARTHPRESALLCWILPTALLLVLLGLEKRFGYLLYMFAIPLIAHFVEASPRRALRIPSTAYLLLQSILGTTALLSMLGPSARTARHQGYQRARDLVEILNTVTAMEDRNRTVYLVNDLVGDHAGPLLRRFATRDPGADLVVLTSRTDTTPHFVKTPKGVTIILTLGERALEFPGVDARLMAPLAESTEEGLRVHRTESITYLFPKGRMRESLIGHLPRIEFGSTVHVTVADPRGIFVYYDAEVGEHRIELPWTH